jgi:Ca-activated chloride channel family protein
MRLEFAEPWILLLLPLAVLLWLWQRRSPAPLSSLRRRWSTGLRVGIFVCVALALTEPRWLGNTRDVHVMWMVDVSRSVGEAGRKEAKAFVDSVEGAPAGSSQSWLMFAGRARPFADAKSAIETPARELRDDATDLANALQFASASFPMDKARTAVIFTDGVETEGDLARQVASLKSAGVRVFMVPVRAEDKPEVLVRSVTAPPSVNEGEPFVLRTVIFSNRAGEADVDVFQNGIRVGTKRVALVEGANTFETTQTVSGEKVTEFSVGVRSDSDTLADNNLAATQVRASGTAKVLLIADKPEQARFLARALRAEEIVLDVRPITGVPNDLGELQNYDMLVLDNVPATDLSLRQMELMAAYVRDFGGGLLMFGGENAFGLGGYHRTPVEEVLPVRCDFEKEKENPSLGLVLVIDRSGSMSGEKIELAKSAARAAVELLSGRDYAGVVAFDNEAFWAADLQSAAGKQGIISRIASIEASGGTNIAPGMELALQALRTSPAKLKHVIVLTDGVSTPGPFQELATQMAQERITCSTVAMGSDADSQLLEQIARWGNGRFYASDSPQNIPQIFTRETMVASKSAIQELPFLPVQTRSAEFLAGVDFKSAPFLLGYVTTRLKPTAELWLMTEKGEPLFATWRYGLGQVGAFTSDARNRWAVEWLRWPEFGKLWAQVFRRLMRTTAMRDVPAQIERDWGGFLLTVDATNPFGQFLEGAEGEAVVIGPKGEPEKIALERTAPGRLKAWFPAADRGAYHVQLSLRKGDEPVGSQYLSATVGYPDEYLLRAPDLDGMRAVAEATGGGMAPTVGEVFSRHPAAAVAEKELWPWLIGLAVLLFVCDVGVRRLNFAGR